MIAVDPPSDGVPLSDKESKAAEFAMRWTYLQSLAQGLGADLSETSELAGSSLSLGATRLRVNDELVEEGISALITSSGPVILRSVDDALFAREFVKRGLPSVIVTLSSKPALSLRQGHLTTRGETRNVGDHSVRDDDLVVTKLSPDTDFDITG